MDDRSLVTHLLEIGVAARRKNIDAYATPSDDSNLRSIGTATIANWLEELGRHRLIGDVQPCFTSSGGGFRFQVTDNAVRLLSDAFKFDEMLNIMFPPNPEFEVFISYTSGDSAIVDELRNDLENNGLKCFMAEKDIQVATEWEDSVRAP
jgi:hypothetical protein